MANSTEKELGVHGIVTLTLRDKDTLEEISQRTETNRLTLGGRYNIGTRSDNDDNNPPLHMRIGMGNVADTDFVVTLDASYPSVGRSSVRQNPIHVDGDPGYVELVYRYDQPGTTRLIRTVMLLDAEHDTSRMITMVRLDPPCEQTSSQVLDITYRVQYQESSDPGTVSSRAKSVVDQLIVDYKYNTTNPIPYMQTTPAMAFASFHKPPVKQYQTFATDYDQVIGATSSDAVYETRMERINVTSAMVQADHVGVVFGSFIYGEREATGSSGTEQKFGTSTCMSANSPTFTNAPIQPTHNHGILATAPFLDVNNLATGTGTTTLDGTNWNDSDYPKYLRMDITNTGDVGTARYSLRYRNNVGFSGNGYYGRNATISFIKAHVADGSYPTIPNGHGLGLPANQRRVLYDGRTLVNVSDVGITIVDIIDGNYVNFDATTTPALPVTKITGKVKVDLAKNVWVADLNSGLYKITDAFGTPTITHFNNASHGIPVGGDVACYAIDVGLGGVVWAVFDGGLCKTTDGGTTWEVYDENSTHPFSYVGISDDNWSTVIGLVVDPEAPNFDMAIVRAGTYITSNQQAIWWSDVDPTSLATSAGGDHTLIACSRSGGLWHWVTSSTGSDDEYGSSYEYRMRYGTTDWNIYRLYDVTYGSAFHRSRRSQTLMMYDYYGSPYVMAGYTYTSSGVSRGMFSVDQKVHDIVHYWSNSSTADDRQFSINFDDGTGVGKGMFMFDDNYYENRSHEIRNFTPQSCDTLNSRYSPFEDFVWDKYQWNGTTWEKGYHKEAIDTSGNANDGIRHNFDVEDYTFTGRSMIDVGSTFTTNNFASVGTFAFLLTPDDKLSGTRYVRSKQEQQSVVFEVNDGTNRLMLYWDNGSGSVVMQDQTASLTVQVTPAIANDYRCVVTLGATTAILYIDGVLAGTLTLGAAVDLSNAQSNIYAHVGARTHAHEYNGRYNVGNFYRGTMRNVQMWNVEWDQTDVTNDFGNVLGVITSKSAANLMARYELTQSLIGLETKTTHVTDDQMIDGITNGFTDGATSPAFVEGEYYTTGIVDGFLKDNAMTITHTGRIHTTSDLISGYSTIANTDGTNVVPSTSGVVTEPATFRGYSSSYTSTRPGHIAAGTQTSGNYGGTTTQSSSGDISIDFTPIRDGMVDCWIGFTATATFSTNQHYASNLQYGFRCNADGGVTFCQSGAYTDNITTYAGGDVFRLQRVGNSITLHRVVDGVPSLIHTATTTSTSTFTVLAAVGKHMSGFCDILMTYVRPALTMSFGNLGGATGIHAYRVLGFTGPVEIFAGGVGLDVVLNTTPVAFLAEPAPGTVYVDYFSGLVSFNVADVGAAITGSIDYAVAL